jgi:hypothetical protein
METQGYVVIIAAISRAVGLAIAGTGGICCIFLGWSLYRDGIRIATSGALDYNGLKIKLVTSGPGVFLVAFGAAILVYLIARPASITMPGPECAISMMEKSSGTPPTFALRPALFGVNDTDGRIKLEASGPPRKQEGSAPKVCKPCRVWAVDFLEGEPLPDEYADALDNAIALIVLAREKAQSTGDDKRTADLRNNIDRLREMRNNLNEK